MKATSAARRTPVHAAAVGFVSFMGRLTASVNDTTLALVEDGGVLGSRQLDLGIPVFDSYGVVQRK